MNNNKPIRKGKDLPLVFNRPIDPASDPNFKIRKTKPVTPKELGGYYLTAGMRNFQQKDDFIDLELLKEDLDLWHNPNLQPGDSSPDLMHHNFGQVIWLQLNFLKAKNWKAAINEVKRRGLYVFDCWGNIPGCRESDEGGDTFIISEAVNCYLAKVLGERFLGWDNGEHDGRWFWQAMRISPAPIDRKTAHQYFLNWFQPFFAEIQNNVDSLCGLLFPHYFAKMEGQRLIGAEFLQALPSVPMWSAWVRGAARQYQILWFSGISIFSNFGYKSFESEGFRFLGLKSRTGRDLGVGYPAAQGGPDRGPTISLLRRTWYVLFMYGTNIEAIETSQLYRPAGPIQPSIPRADCVEKDPTAPETRKEFLSPLGKMQLTASKFCHRYENRRGVQYCPVAAFLDFYAGWNPPRHDYTDSFYTIWGGMPYEAGDHQVDLFFREIFPGYQDCNFFRNEKGFLTQTPYGDITDVLLSDCRPEILKRYRVVCVLGKINVEGETFLKLKEYVRQGGRVVWSLNQLGSEALKFCGIALSGKRVKVRDSRNKQTGQKYREKKFNLPKAKFSGVKVLLETGSGFPIVVKKKIGAGEAVVILPDFGLDNYTKEAHPLIGADADFDINTCMFFDKPIGSPYRFLEGVREVIFPYLAQFNLIEIIASVDPFDKKGNTDRPFFVQHITNVTERPDRLMVTLVNNEPLIIYVRLRVRGGQIIWALDLLHEEKRIKAKNGIIELTLFPSDNADFNLYILELHIDRPVVSFMEAPE